MTPEVPSFPKKLPIVAFATLLTLMLAIGGVIASALLAESGRAAGNRDGDPVDERRRREPMLDRPAFAFPEAMPSAHWSAPADALAAVAPAPVAKAPVRAADAFDLAPLVARIAEAPRNADVRSGRRVLIIETEDRRGATTLPEALTRALGLEGSLVAVDLNLPKDSTGRLGFSDLIAGEAAFLDVIQARRDSGQHRIEAGLQDSTILFDEPDALALTFEAMAETYDWVLCRLYAAPGAVDLLELVASFMDSVVIASNADAEDPALADLYALARDAGAGQILVAQDRPAASDVEGPRMELRLNAA